MQVRGRRKHGRQCRVGGEGKAGTKGKRQGKARVEVLQKLHKNGKQAGRHAVQCRQAGRWYAVVEGQVVKGGSR